MAVNNVIIRDVRLHGWKPQGNAVLEVNFDTPLSWPIKWAGGKAPKKGKTSILKLMSHGYPGGMEFCREHINRNTIAKFDKIKGKYDLIELHACSTGKMDKGGGGPGDGNYLCFRLAQITRSYVRSSRHLQLYGTGTGPGKGIDFGKWQGTVVTWGPKGNIVSIKDYPKD